MGHVQHGGALDRAIASFGGQKAGWLDLSTGINPNPYPVPTVPGHLWHSLPDENLMNDCLAAARAYYDASAECDVVAATGSQALIQLLPQVTLAKTVWIVGPTYNEYEQVFGNVAEVTVSPELPQAVDDIDLIVVGCPNNPDGRVHDPDALLALGKRMHEHGGFVLIDAAFGDVLPDNQMLPASHSDGLIILRSFGKFFGLAGMRLGFALGGEMIIERFRGLLGPWAVPGPALFIGAIAMRDQDWISEARRSLSNSRANVENLMRRHGLDIVGATDLFVTCSQVDSAMLSKSLAHKHILVRTFSCNPNWIRFGLPSDQTEVDRLEKALARAF